MKKYYAFYCLFVLVNLIYSASAQNIFRTTPTSVIGYLESLPQGYDSNSDKYPVVIFLHGLGERGANSTDIEILAGSISLVERNGPPKLVKNGEQFPFILISPQLKSNYGDWPSWYVNEVIDYCKTYLRIDERRIYLTGLSLGGGGTWWTAQDFPKQFAAIAPVCGSRNTLSKACLLAAENLPVWAFHGDADSTVPYMRSVNMVNAINACTPAPNPLAKITIYPGVGHNSWDRAYTNDHSVQNPNVYEWMLSYTNTINGTNKIPLANAGVDVSIAVSAPSVVLSGSGSDSDGSIAAYTWSQLSGPSIATLSNIATASPTASNLIAGTYMFKLKVTDNNGDINADFVKVTVSVNVLPVANAGTDQTLVLPTNAVTLAGSATDPDGSITAYEWSKISGSTATLTGITSSTLTASSLSAGSYIFRLTVTDNLGAARYDDVNVVVTTSTSNIAPVAGAGPDRLVKLPTDPITLFGTATDTDGTVVNFNWTKISGGACVFTSTTVLRPKVSGLVSGTYVFRLTITDDDGATASDDVTIIADYPPVVNAGIDYTITLPTNAVTLTGSATDSDGTISSYLWAKSSGPSATLTNKTTPTLTASGLSEGIYVFRLTVTDNMGAQTIDYAQVIVGATGSRLAVAESEAVNLIEREDSNFLLFEKDNTRLENVSAIIYNENGIKVYEGKWNAEICNQVFEKKGLYIYNLSKEGRHTTGKVHVSDK